MTDNSKPITKAQVHPSAKKLLRVIACLERLNLNYTLTLNESEGYKSTSLFYWLRLSEEQIRRPLSYGAIYATTFHVGILVRVAHAGSGGRTSEKLITAKATAIGSKDRDFSNVAKLTQWIDITCRNPYTPTDAEKAEDDINATKYAALREADKQHAAAIAAGSAEKNSAIAA